VITKEIYTDTDMSQPVSLEDKWSKTVAFTKKCEGSKSNQDALGFAKFDDGGTILCLADGAGGHKGGAAASKIVVNQILNRKYAMQFSSQNRIEIIEGFEESNNRLLEDVPGAASTLVVAEIDENRARFYFAGDSIALVVGGRGKLKYRTYGHNPVDLGIQAGLLDEDFYDENEMRHYVTNIIGSKQMHIEASVNISLDPRDTILICSDGLYDNMKIEEICKIIGENDLEEAANLLISLAKKRMNSQKSEYSKFDDLSFFLYKNQ
jgi:PPM family protein phosphatase